MNLERLYIENYKQLRDPLELFPPEGAIGVVGPNGTGKSTLLEAVAASGANYSPLDAARADAYGRGAIAALVPTR